MGGLLFVERQKQRGAWVLQNAKPSEFLAHTQHALSVSDLVRVSSLHWGQVEQEPRSSAMHLIGVMDRQGPMST